jgi:hypothetical protein
MKKASGTIAIALALVGAFVWNYHHEHTLSTEARAAVVAILGENPPIDITCENYPDCTAPGHPYVAAFVSSDGEYLRAAHLAIRTKQDALVVAELDKAFTLWGGGHDQIYQGCQLFKQVRKDAGLQPFALDPCGNEKSRPLVPQSHN